ncbi:MULTISPECIES: tetratricopeptide repeat protein [unclassified Bradyrhizobium]|uniref:tetratricopeptide repeat protein n=1 Tax=unclassified Bradyrhizobium TaxID=2631580 RepID=UPI001CD375D9|nr:MULTISPECIES: tetratricopeptide repeat protein [unclassified Bradyrhizobium]MCA1390111.1 tetratricopeptide repeat protein [Bradyrhizobium sp. IC3123]MCA1496100.1 tetratricopeptide repeat protein [Bradyrhizobium sp. NBAIM14]MCA1547899.1 tetratricopeptide repeat protein [Bradyrhizobium sp. BRP19]
MCGTHASAQALSPAKISLRALFLGAAMSFVLAAPAAASTECVLGSKAAPVELISACSAIIDQTANSAAERSAALVVRAEANAQTLGGQSQALRDLDRAIALDGKNAKAWRVRGDLLREAGGDLNRAAADLTKAIELDPQDAEAYELRGVVYTNQRRLDRALADYDQAIKLKPDDAQAWSDRGVAYYLGGDNEKAIRNFDEALRLDPDRARTYTNRGAAYKKLGQLDKAVADDGEAIRLDPKVPEYYDNRGLTYAAMGEYDKAIADYDQAIRREQRANFLTNRGDSYQFKGELGAALSDYEAALKLDPNFAKTYNNRAVLYKKMGERKKALADYETALKLDPGNENAANGRRSMIAEIARFGAASPGPMHARSADDSGPSFKCATAKREVEKVICADPQLGVLDRQIAETYERVLRASKGRSASDLRKTQREFLTTRNASFRRPGYDLKKIMQDRLQRLNAMES